VEGFFIDIPNELNSEKQPDAVKKKELTESFRADIRSKNIACYRYSLAVIENDTEGLFFSEKEINKFFVHHIENSVERILNNRLLDNLDYKLKVSYLCEKVWKDIINYFSVKYIAFGKAVFNFGMEELLSNDAEISMGIIPDEIKKGLNSFDYESIKARETLQRELAVNVMFSANNLARATVDLSEKSDFLLYSYDKDYKKDPENKKSDIDKYRLSDNDSETLRSILQFFIGKSKWDEKLFLDTYGSEYASEFLNDLKNCIYYLRNESFHFSSAKSSFNWNKNLIGKMFEQEANACFIVEKDKFYSNNLPMFYDIDYLRRALAKLYANDVPRASQIPAFNNVCVRKNFPKLLEEKMKLFALANISDADLEKWQSALYYLFKEIYYNDFIQDEKSKGMFISAINNIKQDVEKRVEDIRKRLVIENSDLNDFQIKKKLDKYPEIAEKNAVNNFCIRLNEIKQDNDLSQICQMFMTEYSSQNNKRTVRSSKDSILDKEIFKHYKVLLMHGLENALVSFIKSKDEYAFILKKPVLREKPSAEDFLPNFTTNKYDCLIKAVKNDPRLQSWYITGRFLNGKMLNQLVGSMRSYIQYVESVERRANNTQNVLHKDETDMKNYIKEACKVIEICILLSGTFTNNISDYFKDDREYSDYINYIHKYVDYEDLRQGEIFFNEGGKPIVNRNVIMAKLYAPDTVLENCVKKVNDEDIKNYMLMSGEIDSYRVKKEITSKDEQIKILDYQKIKNKVELRTLVEYGEVINELLGQLVNWSYLRERDLFYFQLGFHYACLNNDSAKPDEYVSLSYKEGRVINNAILYQIAAMYIYGIKLFAPKKNELQGKFDAVTGQAGLKIPAFERFSERTTGDKDCLYNAGLELFEVINEHDNIIEIRNYIDHFKYYNTLSDTKSIVDIYSEVFDRFFTYDMKYQKNVMNMLGNILLKHNVIPEFVVETGKKKVSKDGEKLRANIEVRSLEADTFTYNYLERGNQVSLIIAAKNKEYLETIAKILYFPEKKSTVKYIIKEADSVKVNGENSRTEKTNGKKSKDNKSKDNKRNNNIKVGDAYKSYSESESCGSSMADLLKNIKL